MTKQLRTTEMISGYFDCRIFKNGVEKSQRPMRAEGDRIDFTAAFSEYPHEFAREGGSTFIKEAEVNGLKRYYVSLKIGRFCTFFDKDGKKINRPMNADIDSKRYDVMLAYKVLNGDPKKMEARGLWVDAIQMKPAEDLTFAPMDTAQASSASAAEPLPTEAIPDDLPF